MTISKKIMGGYALILVLLALSTVVAFYALNQIQAAYEHFLSVDERLMESANELRIAGFAQQTYVRGIMLYPELRKTNQLLLQDNDRQFKQIFDKMRRVMGGEKQTDLLDVETSDRVRRLGAEARERREPPVARRLLQLVPIAFGITLAVFFFLRLIPGSPALAILGFRGTPETIARVHNPNVEFFHSAAFSWDGKTVVFGDEAGGGTGAVDSGSSEWLITLSTWLQHGSPLYLFLYGAGIAFFCFFYTAVQFNSEETAENLKRHGLPDGFVHRTVRRTYGPLTLRLAGRFDQICRAIVRRTFSWSAWGRWSIGQA